MRYVFLVPAASAGGIQTYAARYTGELLRRGEDVVVALWMDRSLPFSAKERGLFDGVPTLRVEFDGRDKEVVSARHLAGQLGLRDGDCVISQALSCVGHLIRRERETKDILHLEVVPSDLEAFYRFALRFAATCDAYLPVSRRIAARLRERLAEMGAGAIPIAVCPTGIDVPPQYFERLPPPPLKVCYVGRLSREKRIGDLADIGRALSERGVAYEFTVLGSGGEAERLRTRLAEFGLGDRFILAGARRHEEVLCALAHQHAFVLSSEYEGFPNSLCEAMAYGCVPVASRVSGAEDAIRDGENGWLANVGDTRTMAERLAALAADPGAWTRMSRAAYETARAEFSIQARVDVLIQAVAEARAARVPAQRRLRIGARSVLEHPFVPNVATRGLRTVWRALRGRPADAARRKRAR